MEKKRPKPFKYIQPKLISVPKTKKRIKEIKKRFIFKEPKSFYACLGAMTSMMTYYNLYLSRTIDSDNRSWHISQLILAFIGKGVDSSTKDNQLWKSIASCVCPVGSNISMNNVSLDELGANVDSVIKTQIEVIIAFCVGFDELEIKDIYLAHNVGISETSIISLIQDMTTIEQELTEINRLAKEGVQEYQGLNITNTENSICSYILNKGFENTLKDLKRG